MRHVAIVAATLFAVATPALAQDAGAPGATGVGGPMTGSNTGSGYSPNYYSNGPYGYGADGYNNSYRYNNDYGYNSGFNNGYNYNNGYSYNNGYNGPGWSNGNGRDIYNDESAGVIESPSPYRDPPGMIEGRAAAPDYGYGQYQNPSATGPGYPRAGGTTNSQW